uniref:Uncharacterized protein n=1 Tax=Anguilla anguilla TaxID=7936 RepID=A0A0E9T7B5_ANGAN
MFYFFKSLGLTKKSLTVDYNLNSLL